MLLAASRPKLLLKPGGFERVPLGAEDLGDSDHAIPNAPQLERARLLPGCRCARSHERRIGGEHPLAKVAGTRLPDTRSSPRPRSTQPTFDASRPARWPLCRADRQRLSPTWASGWWWRHAGSSAGTAITGIRLGRWAKSANKIANPLGAMSWPS